MTSLIAWTDVTLSEPIRSLGEWLFPFMYSLSFIGQPVFTISTLTAIAIYAYMRRDRRWLIAVFIAGATFFINTVIKLLVQRPRPETYDTLEKIIPTFSFPSGHAAGSMVAFGLLAYLLWRRLSRPWNSIAAISLFMLIIAIGISRIYLGAHYPTDVLAGWLVGLMGLVVIIKLVRPR